MLDTRIGNRYSFRVAGSYRALVQGARQRSCRAGVVFRAALVAGLMVSVASCAVEADPFQEGKEALARGDYAEAFCLWKPLALHGHSDAQYHLGWFYANGFGLRVDPVKAAEWWRKAANQGHVDAQYALGTALLSGEGIPRDFEEAMQWLLKAARQGNEDAQDVIKSLLRRQGGEISAFLPRLVGEDWLGARLRTQVSKANARAGPGLDRAVLTELERGARMTEISRNGSWVQVLISEPVTLAWVHEKLVAPVPGASR